MIPVMGTQNWYMEHFLESFAWLSMDPSKDNFRNNYLMSLVVLKSMDLKLDKYPANVTARTFLHCMYIVKVMPNG
jgi:hypothetical protein